MKVGDRVLVKSRARGTVRSEPQGTPETRRVFVVLEGKAGNSGWFPVDVVEPLP